MKKVNLMLVLMIAFMMFSCSETQEPIPDGVASTALTKEPEGKKKKNRNASVYGPEAVPPNDYEWTTTEDFYYDYIFDEIEERGINTTTTWPADMNFPFIADQTRTIVHESPSGVVTTHSNRSGKLYQKTFGGIKCKIWSTILPGTNNFYFEITTQQNELYDPPGAMGNVKYHEDSEIYYKWASLQFTASFRHPGGSSPVPSDGSGASRMFDSPPAAAVSLLSPTSEVTVAVVVGGSTMSRVYCN